MSRELLDALFESWQTKNEAYFTNIAKEFKESEGEEGNLFVSRLCRQLGKMQENGKIYPHPSFSCGQCFVVFLKRHIWPWIMIVIICYVK